MAEMAMAKTDKQSRGHEEDGQMAIAMAKMFKQSHGQSWKKTNGWKFTIFGYLVL